MTKKLIHQVADEKRRASLTMGDSPDKADRYAAEVIAGHQDSRGHRSADPSPRRA